MAMRNTNVPFYPARVNLSSFYGSGVIPAIHHEQPRTVTCAHCSALLFKNETGRVCCMHGNVKLADWKKPTQYLQDLFLRKNNKSNIFFNNIRSYNSIFSFVSLGAKLQSFEPSSSKKGPYCFRIQGCMYHSIGSLCPAPGYEPKFAQIYFYDTDFEKQVQARSKIFADLDQELISNIQQSLNESHPYVQFFKNARAYWNQSEELIIRLTDNRSINDKKYHQPSASEVAAIMTDASEGDKRDIILTTNTESQLLKRIDELNPSYDCLAYPLFGGNLGYQVGLFHEDGKRKITVREFYAFRLHERPGSLNLLLYGQRLLQQYIVDQYAKVEQENLNYIRYHQKSIRADAYQGLIDSLIHGSPERQLNPRDVGRRIILPSSFTGSIRQMNQLFQDSMTVVREFGKPDIFMTVTCNPNWPEIRDELFPGQQSEDRPDIIGRVFNMKLNEMMKDILVNRIFGNVIAFMYVIEFQKRGLPHSHILLILDKYDKPTSANDIDEFVCAEIPNPSTQYELYCKVLKHMIHGPCGSLGPEAACMYEGRCKKGYPKEFAQETVISEDGYPTYQRNEHTYHAEKNGIMLDNRWVVPYNPYMLFKYNAHINVEICSGIKAIRYLYKYMYKGPDKATMELYHNDEIKQYLNGRYLSASEACWRLFAFKLHNISHTIYRLPVHLPNQQYVQYSQDTEDIEEVLQESKSTMLTQFFELCKSDCFARNLLYSEVPVHYIWDTRIRRWLPRQKQTSKQTLSRIYAANPSENERFYLRLLLLHVKGPTSFESLRTFQHHEYHTFKEAAVARGLFDDDSEWERTLQDGSLNCFPLQLRELFAILLLNCPIKNCRSLFIKFFSIMANDFVFQYHISSKENIDIENKVLLACVAANISSYLESQNRSWQEFDLPSYEVAYLPHECLNVETNQKPCYDYNLLNNNQTAIFNEIVEALVEQMDQMQEHLFYVDGPGGTGKTYLCNTILMYAKEHNFQALAVASTGLASLLLLDGRTAHSLFEIPLDITSQSTCNITKQSSLGKLLQTTNLIIWDEAPMMHHFAVEALDRTLQDIRSNNAIMGGITTVFTGDFRQILPVIPRGSRADIVNATLKKSCLWKHIKCLQLIENMRLNEASQKWHEFLLQIGEGRYPTTLVDNQEYIELPQNILLDEGKNLDDLISFVFQDGFCNNNSSTILTPTNRDAQHINDIITDKCTTFKQEYLSADSTDLKDFTYPTEFLNSIVSSGLPPHKLIVKVGIPIILIRSIAPKAGLCNGTRLRVDSLQRNVITATIITPGRFQGKQVKIPRIDCYMRHKELPFILIRRQFPILIAFSLTINRSQGQGFENLGIYLPKPVFSHGQLYVALSRCIAMDRVKVLIEHNQRKRNMNQALTKNIVYPEIFMI